jgi:endogenous inhibitor of DNA gyrase (YacG/DUF329 family)
MRRKPVTRDEVRFDGEHITTLPADSLRQGEYGREANPKLWAPLLRQLKVKEPWPYSGGKWKCVHCGTTFYRVPGRHSHYCSDKCAAAAHAAAMAPIVKAHSIARAKARANRKCETCGKAIKAQRSTMKFCSVRCRVASHRADHRE